MLINIVTDKRALEGAIQNLEGDSSSVADITQYNELSFVGCIQ